MRATNSVFNVSGPRGAINQRFLEQKIEEKINKLKFVETARKKPDDDGSMKKAMRNWKTRTAKKGEPQCGRCHEALKQRQSIRAMEQYRVVSAY